MKTAENNNVKTQKQIAHLHYITQNVLGFTHAALAERACQAGVKWVQLRLKKVTDEVAFKEALTTKIICQKYGATFIINDRVALAKELKADGVHLGQEDMRPDEARKILGEDAIIGGTANTFEQIKLLHQQGVDYFGVGPFRYTITKQKLSPILGLEGYQAILKQCAEKEIKTPMIAIGGLTVADIPGLKSVGVYGAAVASQINLSESPTSVVQSFYNVLKQ